MRILYDDESEYIVLNKIYTLIYYIDPERQHLRCISILKNDKPMLTEHVYSVRRPLHTFTSAELEKITYHLSALSYASEQLSLSLDLPRDYPSREQILDEADNFYSNLEDRFYDYFF